ncbi:MAG: hypothetical protein ACR2KJ_07425 [Jatrophihabitans sp.]
MSDSLAGRVFAMSTTISADRLPADLVVDTLADVTFSVTPDGVRFPLCPRP